MRRRTAFTVLVVAILQAAVAGAQVRPLVPQDLEAKLKPVETKVFEPHESQERTYRGYRTSELLTVLFGDLWMKGDEVVFHCVDGYESVVPVERLRKHPSILAFESPGRAFRLNNKTQGEQDVVLSPFYLIWENLKDPSLKKESGAYWPYQVASLEVIRFAERYPNLVPAEKSSKAASRGFQIFRTHCMTCHAINGQGGSKSIDLNAPVSVTQYWKEEWLKRWIAEPQKIRPGTTMPPLDPELAERSKAIDDLLAYLKTMARNRPVNDKPAPESRGR